MRVVNRKKTKVAEQEDSLFFVEYHGIVTFFIHDVMAEGAHLSLYPSLLKAVGKDYPGLNFITL